MEEILLSNDSIIRKANQTILQNKRFWLKKFLESDRKIKYEALFLRWLNQSDQIALVHLIESNLFTSLQNTNA